MTIFYTYYSYEEFGRGYIGYRKCPKKYTPETDKYMGSYTDKSFKPTQKIILGIYDNKDEAIADEIVLHKAYDVAANPHFANRANMTSVGFSTAGVTFSAETRQKMSKIHRGKTISAEHRAKMSEARRGKPLSAETRQKMSEAKRNMSAETRAKISKNNSMKRPEVAAKVAAAKRGKPLSAEHGAKLSEAARNKRGKPDLAQRKKAKRFNWENTLSGEKHENLCIAELCDIYPDLGYSNLRQVTIGNQKQHKGWIVVVCYLEYTCTIAERRLERPTSSL